MDFPFLLLFSWDLLSHDLYCPIPESFAGVMSAQTLLFPKKEVLLKSMSSANFS